MQREFALKKIRAHNSEGVKGAMREVEAYRRFKLVLRLKLRFTGSFAFTGTQISFAYMLVFMQLGQITVLIFSWNRILQLYKTLLEMER